MHKYAVRRRGRPPVESRTKMATGRLRQWVARGLRTSSTSRCQHKINSMLSFCNGDGNRLFDSKPFRPR